MLPSKTFSARNGLPLVKSLSKGASLLLKIKSQAIIKAIACSSQADSKALLPKTTLMSSNTEKSSVTSTD